MIVFIGSVGGHKLSAGDRVYRVGNLSKKGKHSIKTFYEDIASSSLSS